MFLPLLEELGIIDAIRKSGFPGTSEIDDVQSVLSFLALKLMGGLRWSYDTKWNFDRALGLFAGLNVLPKATTLSTYSYRITRSQNREFLLHLSRIFKNDTVEQGEFNLDFKAIPHWGDASILEKNWSGSRSKAIKSLLSLIVEDPSTGYLSYTDAEVRQIILTDHGRSKPTFLITNDFDIDAKEIVKKYARRWMVEQEIAEQIAFFNLNNPSSSIVVKVDFDLTLSLLAHNLY